MTENIPWSKELRTKRGELAVKRIRFSVRRCHSAPQTSLSHSRAAWIVSVVLIAVFIYEEVIQSKAQGTPVSFKVLS